MLSMLDLILIKSLEYFSDSSECVEHLLAGHTVWNYMQGAIHIYADIFDRTSNYKSHAKSLNHHKPHCFLKHFWRYPLLMMMWFTLKQDSNLPNLL